MQPREASAAGTRTAGRRAPVRLLNHLIVLLLIAHCSTTSSGANSRPANLAQGARARSAGPLLVDQAQLAEGLTLRHQQPQQPHDQDQAHEQLAAKQVERIKQESRVGAQLGQNAVLNCPVQFSDGQEKPFVVNWLKYPNKLPIYIWYAGYPPHVAQGYEGRVARLGQASLNLSSVRPQDQGLYECKIYYLDRKPDDKANGTWIYLDVQAPPRFTKTPAPVNYVQAGDSLRLACQAQSSPAPILRWYKNKVPIDSDAGAYRLSAPDNRTTTDDDEDGDANERRSRPDVGQSLSQLDLLIDNVQAGSTTGDYVCLASNSEGSSEARSSVQLAVAAVITSLPRNQTRLEGERVEFDCQARALPANITYKWLFNGKPVQQLKWLEGRHTQRRDGSLVIHAVHRDDQGEYRCQASNGLAERRAARGQAAVAEAAAQLQVEFPARITFSPAVQYLPLGLSGLVRCFYAAAPPVEFFTWTLNNQQFDPNADPNVERLQNGSLLVKHVTRHYEGTYRCTPFNKHGSAGSSSAMEVRVEEPPQFELRPADFYKANLNGQVKMPCEARGSPKPQVSWRRVVPPGGGPQLAEGQPAASGAQPSSSSSRPKRTNQLGAPESQPAEALQRRLVSTARAGARLVEDEAADEPDEMHHFYTPTSTTDASVHAAPRFSDELRQSHASQEQSQHMEQEQPTTTMPNAADESDSDAEQQPPAIVYAKLPRERSELKNAHLYLHNLKKEDHGRYECVIENEVATLVASTMLYIEETTPHAPTNVRVDTKAWSARVSWTPGYDGGFEQSFVVWYRQVEHRPRSQSGAAWLPTAASSEPIDVNWHSANVQPGDSASLSIENLSQDTNYEFYVRAKNIIGEGPRSQIVQAQTKRAISGSVTPIIDALASTSASNPLSPDESAVPLPAHESNDDEEGEPKQPLITIRQPVAIIRPEIIQRHQQHPANGYDTASASAAAASSANQQQQQQQEDFNTSANQSQTVRQQATSSTNEPSQPPSGDPEQENKVIHFKLIQTNSTSKRAPQQPAEPGPAASGRSNSSASDADSSQPQVPVDRTTAPQNLSITKVAQGWVLEWAAPERAPSAADFAAAEPPAADSNGRAEAMRSAGRQLELSIDGLSKRQQQAQQPYASLEPAAYTVELREKSHASWHTLTSTGRERSLLIKDLKPGGEYLFRVVAHSALGLKGSPSPEFRYQIPDNRRKPGSAQALSAGVVSGILFFIACIVIAVCGVNMCNKRRKKRAEKAAYVMMACPVLESHHDIAALNSNSLMKNSQCGGHTAAQNRVPSLANSYLSDNLNYSANQRRRKPDALTPSALLDAADKLYQFVGAKLTSKRPEQQQPPPPPPAKPAEQVAEREISFGVNTPLPVDVEPIERPPPRRADEPDFALSSGRPIDDYWIRQPSDRKWGTLTLAAGKLAERRAQLRQKRQQQQQQGQLEPATFAAAAECASRTLPRSFGQLDYDNQNWAQLRRKFFDQKLARLAAPPPDVPPRAHQHQRSTSQIEPPSFWDLRAAPPVMSHSAGMQSRQVPNWTGQLYVPQAPLAPPQHTNVATSCRHPDKPADLSAASLLGKRNSLARSTLPMVAQVSCGPTVLAPPYNQAHDQSMYNNNYLESSTDDPVISNACFGSYKRKRRLPHIEAQFVITKPAQSAECAPSSQLFVRDLELHDNPKPAAGFPLNGQRSEQRQLRQMMPQPRPIDDHLSPTQVVETIDAREKIETYLRHQERQQQQHWPEPSEQSNSGSQPVELEQVDAITYQPYYNLPSLCYTINLPVRRQADGKLVLEETSQLKARPKQTPTTTTAASRSRNRVRRRSDKAREPRQPLGSSSSCPAQTSKQFEELKGANSSMAVDSASVTQQLQLKQVCSLESAVEDPLLVNRPPEQPAFAHDSLEQLRHEDDDLFVVVLDSLPPPPPPLPVELDASLRVDVGLQATAERPSRQLKPIRSRPIEPPPPIPPHQASRLAPINRQPSSSSPSSSSSSSNESESSSTSRTNEVNVSSASSTTANKPNGGSAGGDHSVDENYEFDQNSSCSSPPTTRSSAGGRRTGEEQPGAVYAQVGKQTKGKFAPVERTHHFVDSRFKEQRLAATRAPPRRQQQKANDSNQQTNYYDTVYDG